METYYGTGRRKTAIVRLFLRKKEKTSVESTLNGMSLDEYFCSPDYTERALKPFLITENAEKFVIKATVKGSGKSSQADAFSLALSRALLKYDPEIRSLLKPHGLLTRDARKVERKKIGLKKARKRPQFSKR